MKRPEFTKEQEDWLCEAIGDWYLVWKQKMTPGSEPHRLGIAKEQLKMILCDDYNHANFFNALFDQRDQNSDDEKKKTL